MVYLFRPPTTRWRSAPLAKARRVEAPTRPVPPITNTFFFWFSVAWAWHLSPEHTKPRSKYNTRLLTVHLPKINQCNVGDHQLSRTHIFRLRKLVVLEEKRHCLLCKMKTYSHQAADVSVSTSAHSAESYPVTDAHVVRNWFIDSVSFSLRLHA